MSKPKIVDTSPGKAITLTNPLVVMYEDDAGAIICVIHPQEKYTAGDYGYIICDLVRHVANALDVHEDVVWTGLDTERFRKSTSLTMKDGTWKDIV